MFDRIPRARKGAGDGTTDAKALLIINDLRPEWFVFENVVGILTHEILNQKKKEIET